MSEKYRTEQFREEQIDPADIPKESKKGGAPKRSGNPIVNWFYGLRVWDAFLTFLALVLVVLTIVFGTLWSGEHSTGSAVSLNRCCRF